MRIIVIGAGASGMMAAIIAAEKDNQVTILEHTSKIGRKIEITGNGHCNFTNSNQSMDFYRSNHPQKAWQVVEQFGFEKILAFFTSLGIVPENKNGYYYPHTKEAASVSNILRIEAEHRKVKFACNISILKIEKDNEEFVIQTSDYEYRADRIILATGMMAAPSTGADGSGLDFARAFGHSIITPLPALVMLMCQDKRLQMIAGVRTEGKVSIYNEQGKMLAFDIGELQFNQNSISGIPVFQVSRYAVKELADNRPVTLTIDFWPNMDVKELSEYRNKRMEANGYKSAVQFLEGMFPKKLIRVLLSQSAIMTHKSVCAITENEWISFFTAVKEMSFQISGFGDFEQAQACQGGVSLDDIDIPSMESKLVKGLYFAGEILDVDGACGGYNLSWAWASGYCAGKNAGSPK